MTPDWVNYAIIAPGATGLLRKPTSMLALHSLALSRLILGANAFTYVAAIDLPNENPRGRSTRARVDFIIGLTQLLLLSLIHI